jgi:Uma2 family endonuclease
MAIPATTQWLSEAEYLIIERRAEFKSEFFDGEMFAMAGGTPEHGLIVTNLAGELRNRLKGRPCIVCNADLRLKVEPTGLLTYPDVSVVCGPLRFFANERDVIVNPTLVAEVLSDATEAYDRGKKFEQYRQVASLREYLLVSQTEPRIEQYLRLESDEWRLKEAAGMTSALELPSLGIVLPLAEVFEKVQFVPSVIRPHVVPRP